MPLEFVQKDKSNSKYQRNAIGAISDNKQLTQQMYKSSKVLTRAQRIVIVKPNILSQVLTPQENSL